MRYFKTVSDGYILAIGMDAQTGEEINQAEYEQIMTVIHAKPVAPEGYSYRLTDALEWELLEVETPDTIDTMTETEQKAAAYDILTGVNE